MLLNAIAALILLAGTMLPLYAIYKRMVTGKAMKYAFAINALSFFCLCGLGVMTGLTPMVGAVEAGGAAAAASAVTGYKMIGAGLSTGLACIGGGVAVASAASAAIGAISEDSSMMGKALIFVALAEGIALYGVIISILIMFS